MQRFTVASPHRFPVPRGLRLNRWMVWCLRSSIFDPNPRFRFQSSNSLFARIASAHRIVAGQQVAVGLSTPLQTIAVISSRASSYSRGAHVLTNPYYRWVTMHLALLSIQARVRHERCWLQRDELELSGLAWMWIAIAYPINLTIMLMRTRGTAQPRDNSLLWPVRRRAVLGTLGTFPPSRRARRAVMASKVRRLEAHCAAQNGYEEREKTRRDEVCNGSVRRLRL